MAFTTVTGSNGLTSLVGTSGIDVATIVSLSSNVFVGGQEAADTIAIAIATGNNVASGYTVNGGAGDDTITIGNNLVSSFINGDGGTGTAGNDTFIFGAATTVINSSISAGSGNDIIGAVAGTVATSNATVNGNAGLDTIFLGATNASYIYGGQDTDTISLSGNSSGSLINGNKGSDNITSVGALTLSGMSVYGGNGNDTISFNTVTSGSAGSFFSGDLGDDGITGTNGGNDTINGGDGNDVLTGLNGGDIQTGGAGADTFVVNAVGQSQGTSGNNADEITDFNATGVAATSDILNLGGIAAVQAAGGGATSSSVDLATNIGALNLGAAVGTFAAAGNVALVTLTAGATGAQFAGNYVVDDTNGNGVFNAGVDNIIKINSLAGLAGAII